MKKKLLLLFVFGLACIYPSLAQSFKVDGIYYNVSSTNEVRVMSENSTSNYYSGDIAIPNTVTYNDRTYNVTEIGLSAFSGFKELTSVVFPEGLRTINHNAFYNCPLLSDVSFPESLEFIGQMAFTLCNSLTQVYIHKNITTIDGLVFRSCPNIVSIEISSENPNYSSADGVMFDKEQSHLIYYPMGKAGQHYSIPRTVTHIGAHAFVRSSFTSIEMPEALESIDKGAFAYSFLTSVTIPEKVTTIGESVFEGCSDLKTFIYNAEECKSTAGSWDEEKYMIFYKCSSLTDIEFGANVKVIPTYLLAHVNTISSIVLPEGVKTIRYNAFSGSSLTSIELPSTLEDIGSNAFRYCEQLQSITIPENVTRMGMISPFIGCSSLNTLYYNAKGISECSSSPFADCSSLTSIVIGESVEVIPSGLFERCKNITSIHFPDNVIAINNSAFKGCTSLQSITIPKNIQSVGSSAFKDCTALTTLYLDAENCQYLGGSDNGAAFSGTPLSTVIIGEMVKIIPENAFYGCDNITSITIPNQVTSIGAFAFAECTSLKTAPLPENLKDIHRYSFYNCSALEPVVLPESLETIGASAFEGCELLTAIVIPNNITRIDSSAFGRCYSLASVTYNAENCNFMGTTYHSDYSRTVFRDCNSLSSIIIGESVKIIPPSAFYGCSLITSITIPAQVKQIGDQAFGYCASLNTLYFNAEECESISYGSFDNSPITTVHIGTSVKGIPAMAFYAMKELTTISIPESVVTIGTQAFRDCLSLQSILIPEGVERIEEYTFWGCSGLQSITIPNSITYIGNDAFRDCSALASPIIIPEGITEISSSTFYGCSSLKSVVLPPNLTKIGREAFHECSSLEAITIPESVVSIGDFAFRSCVSLATVYYNAEDCAPGPSWGVFGTCTSLSEVIVGESVKSIPSYLFSGCTNLKTVNIPESVTNIGNSSFENCSSLSTIYYNAIDCSMPKYSDTPFKGCDNIENIFLGESVTSLASNIFWGCKKLTSITIPKSMKKIGASAFGNCTSLSSVIYNAGNVISMNGAFSGCTLYDILIGEDVETIPEYAFSSANLDIESLVIPQGIKKIGDHAFVYLPYLTALYYNAEDCEEIAYNFNGCPELYTVIIGETVKRIPDYAFTGSSTFEYITIPKNVEYIGNHAFSDCVMLRDIYVHNPTPPSCGYNTLGGVPKTLCTLHVPAPSVSLYQNAPVWKEFYNITEIVPDPTLVESIDNNNIRVYPNPVTEGFYVSGVETGSILELLDMNGRLLMKQTVRDNDYITANLPVGMYIVRIHTGNKVIEKKLIKKGIL